MEGADDAVDHGDDWRFLDRKPSAHGATGFWAHQNSMLERAMKTEEAPVDYMGRTASKRYVTPLCHPKSKYNRSHQSLQTVPEETTNARNETGKLVYCYAGRKLKDYVRNLYNQHNGDALMNEDDDVAAAAVAEYAMLRRETKGALRRSLLEPSLTSLDVKSLPLASEGRSCPPRSPDTPSSDSTRLKTRIGKRTR